MPDRNNRTNAIETRTLFDDVLKNSQSASQFGPLRVYRVEETPPRSFGRNGDLALVDNTAFTDTISASGKEPTTVALCQKVPAMVPDGPTMATSTVNGAVLVPGDQFTIDKITIVAPVTITLPGGNVFVRQASEAINAAAITDITASWSKTSSEGSISNPYAAPGHSITINGTTVTFTTGGYLDYIVAIINMAGIPFIFAANKSNQLLITHVDGGTVTVGGANAGTIFGVPSITGGLLTITNDDGNQVDLVETVGTPLTTMGFPTTIAGTPLIAGGEWACFGTSTIAVEQFGVSIGTFNTFNFLGTAIGSIVDAGMGRVNITIDNNLPTLNITVINGQPMLTLEDTTRANKILSVAEQPISFGESKLKDLDWLRILDATDADTGYIADFQGTVVYASAHCENTSTNSKEIHLFINGADQGSIGTLSGGANATFINTTLNVNFNQGDRIRLQAQNGSGGDIEDTVIKLTLKWRG